MTEFSKRGICKLNVVFSHSCGRKSQQSIGYNYYNWLLKRNWVERVVEERKNLKMPSFMCMQWREHRKVGFSIDWLLSSLFLCVTITNITVLLQSMDIMSNWAIFDGESGRICVIFVASWWASKQQDAFYISYTGTIIFISLTSSFGDCDIFNGLRAGTCLT